MKHLNLKQHIVGYEYEALERLTGRNEEFKIQIKFHDGGSIIHYGSEEDLRTLHEIVKSKKLVYITLDNIGEI